MIYLDFFLESCIRQRGTPFTYEEGKKVTKPDPDINHCSIFPYINPLKCNVLGYNFVHLRYVITRLLHKDIKRGKYGGI